MMQASKFDNKAPWVTFWFRILIALDQLANVFLLGFPDETVSGRLGRAMFTMKPKWFVPHATRVVDLAFKKMFNEDNHCGDSIEPEEKFENRRELWKWSK